MSPEFQLHYHVEVLSNTIREPVFIVKTMSEANAKYNDIVSGIKEKTGQQPSFYGAFVASFRGEHYIMLRPCVADCMDHLAT
jgi:hypothetical protein